MDVHWGNNGQSQPTISELSILRGCLVFFSLEHPGGQLEPRRGEEEIICLAMNCPKSLCFYTILHIGNPNAPQMCPSERRLVKHSRLPPILATARLAVSSAAPFLLPAPSSARYDSFG